MTFRRITVGKSHIWHDGDLLDPFDARIFDPGHLRRTGTLTGTSTGRNQAFFLRHQGHEMVLRHFWRGGLVGRINPDLYLRQRVANSRAMREAVLLDWMRGQGLPVPRPVAARYCAAGLFYRADIITLRLPDTRTLAEMLRKQPLTPDAWAGTGTVIARFHDAGVYHSDLNCRNILLDDAGAVWLIDFDKCERRDPGRWMRDNLDRLQRSFAKEKAKVPGLHWQQDDWQALLAGYHAARTAG